MLVRPHFGRQERIFRKLEEVEGNRQPMLWNGIWKW